MVETRRTSRRLQAKAAASPTPSPMTSPAPSAPVRKARRTPSPRSRAKKQEEPEKKETEDEQVVLEETEEQKEQKTEEKEEKEGEVVLVEEEEQVIMEETDETEKAEEIVVLDEEEEEEEEIMLLDDEEGEEQEQVVMLDEEKEEDEEDEEEDDDEDEDVDQYAFLAASGLNLSKTAPSSTSTSTATATAKPTATALKRKLVPNQLDSGASQYKEFFDFDGSKRSTAATLRADARADEEAKLLAAGRKAMAHSERQRVESQNKKSAGRRWFNFESEEMTEDSRRDFALLRMRNYLDPKKFYKSSDHSRALPKHFQMGEVIEGASEFHSARLTKKQRRKTFTDEIMADEDIVQYTHRVSGNIQRARSNQGRKKRRRN